MGTGGRTGLAEGEGHSILGGWRKEVRIMDKNIDILWLVGQGWG